MAQVPETQLSLGQSAFVTHVQKPSPLPSSPTQNPPQCVPEHWVSDGQPSLGSPALQLSVEGTHCESLVHGFCVNSTTSLQE
jgi:hypothetical protein